MTAAPHRPRDPLLDRLFAIVSGRDAARALSVDEWNAMLTVARAHAVEPLLAQRVLGAGEAPPEIDETLRRIQEQTAQRNVHRLRDFATVTTALHARGIPVIALKGMHLVPLVYRNLAERTMIDLDLLVPRPNLSAAADALRELGYDALVPYRIAEGDVPYYAHHLPPFLKEGGSTVELHWDVHPPRNALALDVAELWERASPARIGAVDARVLAVEDLLLHLALHATYGHRCDVSARACCDVAAIIRTQSISWDAVIDRARRWKIGAGTYLVLRLTRELFDAAIPTEVLQALQPEDFDEQMLHIALRGEGHRKPAQRLLHARGAIRKLRTVRDFVFIGRDQLADVHRISRWSPLVYGLYFVRAASLLKRWREVAAVFRDDSADADESAAIDNFLGGAAQ